MTSRERRVRQTEPIRTDPPRWVRGADLSKLYINERTGPAERRVADWLRLDIERIRGEMGDGEGTARRIALALRRPRGRRDAEMSAAKRKRETVVLPSRTCEQMFAAYCGHVKADARRGSRDRQADQPSFQKARQSMTPATVLKNEVQRILDSFGRIPKQVRLSLQDAIDKYERDERLQP